MREHQIVISLKADQFEEVQRLARAAGVRSVSAFVRQRLLTMLGVNAGGLKVQPESAQETDLTQISEELQRMQRELQVFIAESLSQGSYWGAEPLDLSMTLPDVQDEWGDLTPEPEEDDDEPIRGAIPDSPWSRLTQSWSTQVPGAVQPTGDLAQSLIEPDQFNPTEPPQPEPPPAEVPIDIFAPEKSQRVIQSAKPEFWRSNSQPPESLTKLLEGFGESKDELENLAERAFAISPRLGAMDANYRLPSQDPLADLLPEAARLAQAEASRVNDSNILAEQPKTVDQSLPVHPAASAEPTAESASAMQHPLQSSAASGNFPTEVDEFIPAPTITPVRSLHAASFLPEPQDSSIYMQTATQQNSQSLPTNAQSQEVPAEDHVVSESTTDSAQMPTGSASPTRPRAITPDADKGPMEGQTGISGGPPPKKRQT